MVKPKITRSFRELTPREKKRIELARKKIAAELPDLIRRHKLAVEAAKEDTLSGAVRQAIHRFGMPLTELARRVGIGSTALDEFLTAERTLRSDVLDRLVKVLGLRVERAPLRNARRKMVS